MRQALYQTYSMTVTDFLLLLSAVKAEKVFCPGILSQEINKDEYFYSVQRLTQTGVLSSEGEKLTINSPFREMADAVASAERVIALRSSGIDGYDYCVYATADNRLVTLSASKRKRNAVELTLIDEEAYHNSFFPWQLLLPESAEPLQELSPTQKQRLLERVEKFKAEGNLSDISFVLGIYTVDVESGSKEGSLLFCLAEGCCRVDFNDGGIECKDYSREEFTAKIKRETRELMRNDNR